MAKKKQSNELSTTQKVSIGIGLTTAAVAAAGAYFLYGSPNAAKNRKTVKSWVLKAKAEVLEALEDAKEMSQHEYEALVDTVAGTYQTFKNASKKDIKEFKDEMKMHWKGIEKNVMKPAAKKPVTMKVAPKKKEAKA